MTAARAQRASKIAALSKFTAAAPSESEQDEQSDVTTDEDPSGDESS
jgi:condensin complex subunit 3